MIKFEAIIFDFDGVLLESEIHANVELAKLLTELGFHHSLEDTLTHYVGLSGNDFLDAIEMRIGTKLPPEFHERMKILGAEALRDGISAVAGAVEFVNSLPVDLPKAVASSSSTQWVGTHLKRLGLENAFGNHIYSGREHVRRGKPAPDLYLHAARELKIPIAACVIIEDSMVGATGALASGATVIGLAAGKHCLAGHVAMLEDVGVQNVARNFGDVAQLIGVSS